MSEDIVIKSRDDALLRLHKFQMFEMQYRNFIKVRGKEIADQYILEPTKKRMREIGYSQKIIEGTSIENFELDTNGEMTFDLVSDYQSGTGFDVARAREYGTIEHFVAPVVKRALSFLVNGMRYFSSGHWVRGITPSNVVTKSSEEFTPKAQAMLDEETDAMLLNVMTK